MRRLGPYSRPGAAGVGLACAPRIRAGEALAGVLVTPRVAAARVAEGARVPTARAADDRIPELLEPGRQGTYPLIQEESGKAGGRVGGESRSGALRAPL